MAAPRSVKQSEVPEKAAYVETYGCQMNTADGELMAGILSAAGYRLATEPEDADVVIVNTCAIREHAEQRVIGRVGELNRLKLANPNMVIGVTGCMAQRMGEQLLERAPYVDLVMGPDGYRSLPDVLARLRPAFANGQALESTPEPDSRTRPNGAESTGQDAPATDGSGSRGPDLPIVAAGSHAADEVRSRPRDAAGVLQDTASATRLAVLELSPHENYEGLESRRASAVSAWVPIQRGCNYRCTYCIVPYVRGSEKNRDPDRIIAEVRAIAESGITEVVLLGQTVNSYEFGEWRFARLLRSVARVDGIRRVRYTSPHPNDLTPELVEVMATEPSVCEQLHLPVQSGHDRTLKRMLRRYTVATYLDKVRMLRAAMPDIALSTDVIVAFPGETEAEYEATLALLAEVRYDDAFLYKYSARAGTPATRLPASDFVSAEIAQARLQRIIDVQRSIQSEINAREVGRVENVLVERAAKSEGDMLGRTARNKVVAFPCTAGLVNTYLDVRLTETTGATFRGLAHTAGRAGSSRSARRVARRVTAHASTE